MTPSEPPDLFWEDMGRKAESFFRTRGRLSNRELSEIYGEALAQIEVLGESRTRSFDPGGTAPKRAATLSAARRGARVGEVENPLASASNNFATPCVEVTGVDANDGAVLKLRLKRGAATRLELRSAFLFRFDDRSRRWCLVEHSGCNGRSRYVWGLVHRPGTYAAIALPKDAREIALHRFVQHYTSIGMESGVLARAEEYFEQARFRRVASEEHGLSPSRQLDRKRLKPLLDTHRETRSLRGSLPTQLPSGGLPEWHLIEHLNGMGAAGRLLLGATRIDDLVDHFSGIFGLLGRVGRWYPLGPENVNGRVKSLAIHPRDGAVLYAGAANGGVWKTSNGGASWRALWKFQDTMAVGAIAIAPSAPSTIYAATGEDVANWGPSYGGVGVYKSTDAGGSWEQKGSAVELGARCSKLVIHPRNSRVVYLAGEGGVHRSEDGGNSWTQLHSGHATDLVMAPDVPETLYAGIWNDGLYKSTDGGATWVRNKSRIGIRQPFLPGHSYGFPTGSDAGWIKLAIGRDGPAGSSFLIAKLGDESKLTYVTADGGASWQPLGVSDGVKYDEWTSLIAINPADPRRILIGSVGLQHSVDGVSFSASSGTHSDHHAVVFHPTQANVCYVASDGGVYLSVDSGATWRLSSDGMQATQLESLGVSQDAQFLVGAATQDQGIIQTEGSVDWNDWHGGNEWGMFVVDPNDSANVFISPGDGELRHSRDRGRNYTRPTSGLTDWWASQGRQTRPASFAHVAVQPGNSRIVIGGAIVAEDVTDADGNVIDSYPAKPRLFYSLDGGDSWRVSYELPSSPARVAFAPSNGGRAYAATVDGRFYRSSTCGTAGWQEAASAANRPPSGSITCIAVDPSDPDRVFVTYGNVNPHIYRSEDGGGHWLPLSGAAADTALPDIAVSALQIDPVIGDILYAGTDIGVFRSSDGGASWHFYNDSIDELDLPKVPVTGLAHRNLDSRLFAATLGRGLYYTYTRLGHSLRVVAISHMWHGRAHLGIEYLRVTDGADTWVLSREELIRKIEAGVEVYTTGADGSRAEVEIRGPDETSPRQYLRTHPDATKADNLLSLPQF